MVNDLIPFGESNKPKVKKIMKMIGKDEPTFEISPVYKNETQDKKPDEFTRKFSFLIEPGVLPEKKEHPQEFNKDHLDFKFEIKKPELQKTKPFELSSKPSRDYPLINPDSISWENRMKRKVTAESGDSGNFWILFWVILIAIAGLTIQYLPYSLFVIAPLCIWLLLSFLRC